MDSVIENEILRTQWKYWNINSSVLREEKKKGFAAEGKRRLDQTKFQSIKWKHLMLLILTTSTVDTLNAKRSMLNFHRYGNENHMDKEKTLTADRHCIIATLWDTR